MRSTRSFAFLLFTLLALTVLPGVARADDTAAPTPTAGALAPADPATPACAAPDPLAAAGLLVDPIAEMGPPTRQHYCKCGCGATCQTDADCGEAGSCVAFVTCC